MVEPWGEVVGEGVVVVVVVGGGGGGGGGGGYENS